VAKTTFRIEGLAELKDALEELPKATGTNVLKRALTKAAEPLEADAERTAPVGIGTLQRSIKVSGKLSRRQKSQHKKESKVELFIGPAPLVQAITQEFGTVDHGPKPFMRPAWDGNKLKALGTIKDILAAEIEKARQRLARKAAKLLAKT
jgi:HK97 gp10 family phage protein